MTHPIHDTGERETTATALHGLIFRFKHTGEETHADMLRRWAAGVTAGQILPADVPHLLRNARTPQHLRPVFEQTAAELAPQLTANPPITSRVPLSALCADDVIRFDHEPVRLHVKATRWVHGLNAYAITFDEIGERTYLASEAHIVTRYDRQELTAMTVIRQRGGKFAADTESCRTYLLAGVTKKAATEHIASVLAMRADQLAWHNAREQRFADAGWRPCAPANLRPGDLFTTQKGDKDLCGGISGGRPVERVEQLDSGAAMIWFSDEQPGRDRFQLWVPSVRSFTRTPQTTTVDEWAVLAAQVGA